jgi:CHASE3 domain sensor protein
MTQEEQFAHFEKMGEKHVRDMAQQWQGPLQALAYKWLIQKDQESRLRNEASQARNEASQAEHARTARTAKNAAVAAAIAAIIIIIISTLTWLYPRH